MGGFSSGPGTGDTGIPDIPIPDFASQAQQTAQGLSDAGVIVKFWTEFWLAILPSIGKVLAFALAVFNQVIEPILKGTGTLISLVIGEADLLMVPFIDALTQGQGEGQAGFYTLLSSVMNDFLGLTARPINLSGSFAVGGDKAAILAAGGSLFDQLALEFSIDSPGLGQPSSAPAKNFLGYLMQYSVRESNIGFLLSLIPKEYRIGDRLTDFASNISRNIGLGRLARQALKPLLTTLVADPLTASLNQQYTPKLLGAPQAIKAWARGIIDQPTRDAEIAMDGYTPLRGQALIKDTLTQLSPSEILLLVKTGVVTPDGALEFLATAGVDPSVIPMVLGAATALDSEPYTQQFVQILHQQLLNGFLSAADYQTSIQNLHLNSNLQSALMDVTNLLTSLPRRRATLAEEQQFFLDGIIDFSEYQSFLAEEGYSQDDQTNLTLALLLKQGAAADQTAVTNYRYKKAVLTACKKGLPPPPPPDGIPAQDCTSIQSFAP